MCMWWFCVESLLTKCKHQCTIIYQPNFTYIIIFLFCAQFQEIIDYYRGQLVIVSQRRRRLSPCDGGCHLQKWWHPPHQCSLGRVFFAVTHIVDSAKNKATVQCSKAFSIFISWKRPVVTSTTWEHSIYIHDSFPSLILLTSIHSIIVWHDAAWSWSDKFTDHDCL